MSIRENGQPPRGRRRLRFVALTGAILAISAYLLLPMVSSSDWLRSKVERVASSASGQEIHIDRLSLGYDLGVYLVGVSVADPQRPPFLMAERATVRLSLGGLFQRQPVVLELAGPRFLAHNLPQSGGASGNTSLPIRRLDITDGYVSLSTADGDEIGPITVSLDTHPTDRELRVSAEVDPRLPPIDVAATIATPAGALTFEKINLAWRDVPMKLVAERFPAFVDAATIEGTLDVTGAAAGRFDALRGSGNLSIHGFRYQTGDLEVAGDIETPIAIDGNVVDLADPGLRVANPKFAFAGIAGTASKATIVGQITRADGAVHATGKISLGGIQAHDPTFERVIEKLALDGAVEATWSAADAPMLRIDLAAPRGELLWKRFYAEIGRHPVKLAGTIHSGSKAIEVSKIDVRVAGIGSLKGDARLRTPANLERLAARVEVTDLGSLYALAFRDPYKESFPFLSQTTLGGTLSARVEYASSSKGFSLTGDLRVANLSATASDPGVELHGLGLDLPLQFGNAKNGKEHSGQLRLDGLRVGNVTVSDINATLRVRPNVVELGKPVVVPMLGGTLRLTEFTAEELTAAQPRAALGMVLRNVDLEALSTAMGIPSFHGSVSGAIPRLTVHDGRVSSEGEIRIQAFGGNIAVRNLSVDQLFSSVPTLGLDLDFDEISLNALTETLEVGRVSGVTHGAVHDLTIVNGQPSSFDAWMETVERPGITQRISLTAIRQLSILSGSGGDPFSQGILGLFDEYRYARMGFRCHLENDRFLLRGIETDEGKEYLVVGSFLPPRVNVVSHNQVISFSEMVRRLQRVATASTAEEKETNE